MKHSQTIVNIGFQIKEDLPEFYQIRDKLVQQQQLICQVLGPKKDILKYRKSYPGSLTFELKRKQLRLLYRIVGKLTKLLESEQYQKSHTEYKVNRRHINSNNMKELIFQQSQRLEQGLPFPRFRIRSTNLEDIDTARLSLYDNYDLESYKQEAEEEQLRGFQQNINKFLAFMTFQNLTILLIEQHSLTNLEFLINLDAPELKYFGIISHNMITNINSLAKFRSKKLRGIITNCRHFKDISSSKMYRHFERQSPLQELSLIGGYQGDPEQNNCVIDTRFVFKIIAPRMKQLYIRDMYKIDHGLCQHWKQVFAKHFNREYEEKSNEDKLLIMREMFPELKWLQLPM